MIILLMIYHSILTVQVIYIYICNHDWTVVIALTSIDATQDHPYQQPWREETSDTAVATMRHFLWLFFHSNHLSSRLRLVYHNKFSLLWSLISRFLISRSIHILLQHFNNEVTILRLWNELGGLVPNSLHGNILGSVLHSLSCNVCPTLSRVCYFTRLLDNMFHRDILRDILHHLHNMMISIDHTLNTLNSKLNILHIAT